MRIYCHLLKIARSKDTSISTKRWFHLMEHGSIRSHPFIRHHQPPPPYSTAFSRVSYLFLHHHNHQDVQMSTLDKLELPKHEKGSRYPLDYKVTVKDRDVICATYGVKNEYWLPQSNLDLLLPPLNTGVFFCYKKKEGTLMSPETVVNTIKKSLAGVLSTFYPLAGEIVPNSHGEPEVLCNNNGVEFVHAHADVELEALDLHYPDETVEGKLVPKINHGVLSVQVTELNCGAIVLSCALDHRIADGFSLNMFLVAWAEFARLKNISIIPSFRPSILNPRRPPRHDTMFNNLYLPISSLPPPPSFEDKLHSRIYYVGVESINHLQSQASSKEARRSKIKSFIAFIWKLLAQEEHNDVNKRTRMGVVVNGRKFLTGNSEKESSMLANHFGNILSIPYGDISNDHLQAMSLSEVENEVHAFLSNATLEEHFRGLIDWVELHRPEPAVAKIYFKLHKTDGDAVVVSSGQGLPIIDMDFGWSKPDFGSYHFPWGGQTGYIATMPSAKKNGDWIVYAHLKQKHLDLIESKAHHVFNPITPSYLRSC